MKSSSLTSPWNDSWYPRDDGYYVSENVEQTPIRQGDILALGSACKNAEGEEWLGCILIHPSCEVSTGKTSKIQVVRIRQLQEHKEGMQEYIVAGESTDSNGNIRVAMAHTFFLAPVEDSIGFSSPMFADFRDLTLVEKDMVTRDRRIAVMSHDARVYFIRRYLYWRQRWKVHIETVLNLERLRISEDPNFQGPRPAWAPLGGSTTPS